MKIEQEGLKQERMTEEGTKASKEERKQGREKMKKNKM